MGVDTRTRDPHTGPSPRRGRHAFHQKDPPRGFYIKKLERNYNVIIQNNYQELNDIRFNASFDTETISQVFEAFNKNYPMKFTVTGKNVIIEKP